MLKKTKLLLELREEVARLTALLESNEIKQLRKDSEELHKLKSLLAHVKFKIKNVQVMDNQETNRPNIVVTYELPRVVLELDENGNPNKNDFFYSTNMLNMISLDDMSKFQNELKRAQNRRFK